MSSFNLQQHEIAVENIHRNLPPSALYEHAVLYEKDAHIAENGALVAYSGVKTGRSPKDKRVVKQTLRRTMSGGEGQYSARSAHICDNPRAKAAAKKLASLFAKNFATYEEGVSAEVKAAGPNV
jgi:ATP-dependent phosphoenolpyruvate carboxykinase